MFDISAISEDMEMNVEDLQPCTAYVFYIQTVNPTNLRTPAEHESFQMPWTPE